MSWLRGVGWVSAGSLAVGDLVAAEHGWVEVSGLRAGGTTTVFNLAVDELSTYLVATTQGQWIWVHNVCPVESIRVFAQKTAVRRKAYADKQLKNIKGDPDEHLVKMSEPEFWLVMTGLTRQVANKNPEEIGQLFLSDFTLGRVNAIRGTNSSVKF